jgi:hypothetical protein
MTAKEAIHQRVRQADNLDNRRQTCPCDLPERRLRKAIAPEGLPSSDGRAVDPEKTRKLAHPARRRPLANGADQDDHGTQVDLPAKKAHRRRRQPLSAAITLAAEAKPLAILVGQVLRAAPWCTRAIGAVHATAARATLSPSAFGQIPVNR